MGAIPREKLKQLFFRSGAVLSDEEVTLLDLAYSNNTADINWAAAVMSLYAAKSVEVALGQHADALSNAADASDRYAASLSRATWFLALATIALVLVSILR